MIFLIAAGVGILLLLVSLFVGDFEFGGEAPDFNLDGNAEVGSVADTPSPTWASMQVWAPALAGFGIFGFLASYYGAPLGLEWIAALVGFFIVGAGMLHLVLSRMAKWQSNNLLSRHSYVGRVATVDLSIPLNGNGQIIFVDGNGARVAQTAITDDGQPLPRGAKVIIVSIAQEGVVVTSAPQELQEWS